MHPITLFILTILTLTYALPLRQTLRGADSVRRHKAMKRDASSSVGPTTTSTVPVPSQSASSSASPVPTSSSSTPKFVFAHHMVGNTFPYTVDDWTDDINLAHSS